MIIYRTTNLINGKTYVGLDTRNKPSYLGSGIAIKNAIAKYGKENFKKEILEDGFSSIGALQKAEIKWISIERNSNTSGTYNMHDGGSIGDNTKGKTATQMYGEERAYDISMRISETLKRKGIKPPSRLGAKGSEKQREFVTKMSKKRKKSPQEIEKLVARTVRPIICLQTNVIYGSLKEAAQSLGLSKGNICSVLKGNRRHTKGFTFQYLEKK